ncbi:Outer membrane protein A [Eubacterium plexicaudatum ASF492]|uniref:OmpA-like domain-containing protein n=1 Tax=Eubacterium plexicaudatum ASF492 TaxID=1235802 RepID=N2BQ54_9FIRM|nr:Outer membrane protein A [Eubacterium plexicaudatum ASF492]
MAKQKQEEPPKGSPAWMATFSDLMNLLLCFFVLLFSMSSVDEEKFEALIASLQSQYSILKGGGSSVGEGKMVSAGINQMQKYDVYFNPKNTSSGEGKSDAEEKDILHTLADDDGANHNPDDGYADAEGQEEGLDAARDESEQNVAGVEDTEITEAAAKEVLDEAQIRESEQIADKVDRMLKKYGIQDMVDVDFNGQYVAMTLNGAILFTSGSSELAEDALPLVDKIGTILQKFKSNTIEIEGHTDNVPVHNARFADNNVLSMYRALSVADYLRASTHLNPANIKSSGRGDYVPIADNGTPEGRAQNRRVEIKVFNSYNSDNME